jgi:hypothetical protein
MQPHDAKFPVLASAPIIYCFVPTPQPPASSADSSLPLPKSQLPTPYSLFPIPYSLFPLSWPAKKLAQLALYNPR